MSRHLTAVVLLLTLALTGCAMLDRSLLGTAAGLKAVGNQFADVSEQVTQGCEQKLLSKDTCADYRAFGIRFKQTYPLAVSMWEAARTAGDGASMKRAEDIVQRLVNDMTAIAARALAEVEK